MTYSIWLEPTSQDAQYLKKIILSLAKKHNAPVYEPHITIYSKIPTLRLAIRALKQCTHVAKIKTQSTNIKSSNDLWKTIFINVRKNADMLRLNQMIKNIVGHSVEYDFNPHISLIYKTLDDDTKRQIIKGLKIKCVFAFDKISIVKSSRDVSQWKKIMTITL